MIKKQSYPNLDPGLVGSYLSLDDGNEGLLRGCWGPVSVIT